MIGASYNVLAAAQGSTHNYLLKLSFSEKATKMCAYGFEIYLVNIKTIRTIAQIFVAFSEKLNFNGWDFTTSRLLF